MRAKPRLKRLHRVAVDVAHPDIGGRVAGSTAGQSFIYGVEKTGGAHLVLYQRHVLVPVVGVVEPGSRLVRIHHTDLDHVVSWSLCIGDAAPLPEFARSAERTI